MYQARPVVAHMVMATTTAHPVARADGAGSVAIAAPVRGAMIVTGHNNTVEMQLTGVGAVLAFAFRWNRPRPRKRRDRAHAGPARLDNHVDRDEQIAALLGTDGAPRVVNVYGAAGIGKTHVLVEALNRTECEMPDGIVYLDGRDQSADDLLHAVFDELYECRVQRRDLRIERLLSSRRAVLALEDVELTPDASQRLVLGAPRCRLLVTSRSRVLFDATPVSLNGLAPEHAAAIAEQELGRRLDTDERRAAESIAARLDGHPLALRQVFSRARDEGHGRPLGELESWLTGGLGAVDRIAALTPVQRRAARALAVHGTAPLGHEHLRAVAGPEAVAAAIELEARHDTTSHSPRHSLVGILAEALPQEDLADETDRALEHFTDLERRARRRRSGAAARIRRTARAARARARRATLVAGHPPRPGGRGCLRPRSALGVLGAGARARARRRPSLRGSRGRGLGPPPARHPRVRLGRSRRGARRVAAGARAARAHRRPCRRHRHAPEPARRRGSGRRCCIASATSRWWSSRSCARC